MIIFELILTTFESSIIFKAAGAVLKIGSTFEVLRGGFLPKGVKGKG